MRSVAIVLTLASLVAAQPGRSPDPPQDSAAFLESHTGALPPLSAEDTRRISALLHQMTVKDKVGQMTQLEIGMITDGAGEAIHVSPD